MSKPATFLQATLTGSSRLPRSISIRPDLFDALAEIAGRRGSTINKLVERAIVALLEEIEKEKARYGI